MESPNDQVLSPGQSIRAPGTEELARTLLKSLYGLRPTKVTELNAYDDRNYHVLCEASHANPHLSGIEEDGYTLKIMNSLDSRKIGVVEAQSELLIYLNQRDISCPLPVKNLQGSYYSSEELNPGVRYIVRLLVFRPGVLLHRVPMSDELLRNVGSFTARLDKTLMGFSHPAYDDHKSLWMLASVPKVRQFTFALKTTADRELANEVIFAFEEQVLRATGPLEQGIIHGDLNEQNIVMGPGGADVAAIIDFGDSHRGCVIFDLVIALCYMIIESGRVAAGKSVIEGYTSVRRLIDLEKRILKTSVCARICQSLVLGAYSHLQDPRNEYVLGTQKSGWTLLRELWPMGEEEVLRAWGLVE